MDSIDSLIRELNKNFGRFHQDWLRRKSLDWWLAITARARQQGILFQPFEKLYEVEGDNEVFIKTNETLRNLKYLQDFFARRGQYEAAASSRESLIKLISATSKSDYFIDNGQGMFKKHFGNTIGYYHTSCDLVNCAIDLTMDGINPLENTPKEQNLN